MKRRNIGVAVLAATLLFVLTIGWTCPLEFLVGAYAVSAVGGMLAVW